MRPLESENKTVVATSFQNLRDTLRKLEAQGNIAKCVEMARNALGSMSSLDRRRYCEIRFKLAAFLLAYQESIPSEHIEEAISIRKEADKVLALDTDRITRARNQSSLGWAYKIRVKGDKERNLRRALYYYRRALAVFDRRTSPLDWAMANVEIADVYFSMTSGNVEQNLQKTLTHLQDAITVYTKEKYPADFTDTAKKVELVKPRIALQAAKHKRVSQ